jgi:type I restriction enzyme, S subunit
MSEWKEFYLSDIGTLARGKSKHRPRWADHLYGGFYPFIQTGEISAANKYISTYRQTYSEAGLAQSKLWEKGTLCITIAANIAEIAILDFPACFPDSVLGFIPNPEKADLDFVFYTLTFLKEKIQNLAIGSVQENINLGTFKNIKFLFPPIEEQKQIAAVLSLLDRKIENLRKQNETLERIAQTLFKHWFVDFEFPNDKGKPYKSSGGEMVRSELGEIPVGWHVGNSGDLIYLQGGFAFKSKDFKKSGNHQIIKIRNISGNVVDIQQTDFIADSTAKNVDSKFKIISDDVLIAMTGAEVAKMGLVPTNSQSLWLNQRVGLFRELVQGGRAFIYCLFTGEGHQKLLRDKGSGSSAQPNISGTDIESIPLIKPSQKVLNLFAEVAEPLLRKKCDNLQKIQTLSRTRDVLLPKLMSGQLRITEGGS